MAIKLTDFSANATAGDFEKSKIKTVAQLQEAICSAITRQLNGWNKETETLTVKVAKRLWPKLGVNGYHCPVKYAQNEVEVFGPGNPASPDNLKKAEVEPYYLWVFEQVEAGALDAEIIAAFNSWMEATHHSDLCLPLPVSNAA